MSSFTFQYVSINTLAQSLEHFLTHFFTFQYVSINTFYYTVLKEFGQDFTFQYVSINTFLHIINNRRFIGLYIPICFY